MMLPFANSGVEVDTSAILECLAQLEGRRQERFAGRDTDMLQVGHYLHFIPPFETVRLRPLPLGDPMGTPLPIATHAKPQLALARSKPARSRKTPAREPQFGFTVRLNPAQRQHFESLALIQGHRTIAAAFKAQALATGHEHPLREMRLSLEHMQERITDEGAELQDRILTVSQALHVLQRNVEDMVTEMQTCTQAMLLFAQTNEALTQSVSNLQSHRGRQVPSASSNLSPYSPGHHSDGR